MFGKIFSAALLLLPCLMPLKAHAQLARTQEDAQQFLLAMLESRTIHFTIGNKNYDRQFGLIGQIGVTQSEYDKKLFSGWTLRRSYPAYGGAWVYMEISEFTNNDDRGNANPCMTTAGKITLKGVGDFKPGELTLEISSLDSRFKTVKSLDQDPRQIYTAPYIIDWRQATFDRTNLESEYTRFLIRTDNRAPYAQITVNGDSLADFVENAIRVLQLSCHR